MNPYKSEEKDITQSLSAKAVHSYHGQDISPPRGLKIQNSKCREKPISSPCFKKPELLSDNNMDKTDNK